MTSECCDFLGSRWRGFAGLAQVQAALRDHEGHPQSICRHPNDDPRTGFWQSVFSAIIAPEKGRMLLTRGTPCDREYEVYQI
jgi:isopenicillin-N N-acyltransferase-like protein